MNGQRHCPNCNRLVETFQQEYTTLPQDNQNKVRRYKETFCAYCGRCLERETKDEATP